MSQAPAEPTTDPAADPNADPSADPQGDPTPADPATDPQQGDPDPRVTRANQQAANYRTQLRAEQQARTELETKLTEQGETLARLAAVFNPDAAPTDDPAQQLAAITGEAENLRTEVSQLRAELLVHNLAGDPEVGANATRLLDSRSFTNVLHGLDPAAEDYTDQVAKAIKDAVSKDASLSTGAGQGPSRGGAEGAGQGPAQPAGAVTQEQFNAMSIGERNELYRNNPNLYRRLADNIR